MSKKFGLKLYGGLTLACSATALLLVVAFFSLRNLVNEQRTLIEVHLKERLLAGQIRFQMESQFALMPAYVLSGENSLLPAITDARTQLKRATAELRALAKDPSTLELIRSVEDLESRQFDFAQPGIRMRKQGASALAVDRYFRTQTGPVTEQIKREVDRLVSAKEIELDAAKLAVQKTSRQLITGLLLVSGITLLLVILAAALFARFVRAEQERDYQNKLRLEQERKLSLARKETVEVVAHDLRGPLSGIRMSLELLGLQSAANPEVEETLAIATRSADAMRRLIDDLLDHAKIESGHLGLNLADCDMRAIAREITERFSPLAKRKEIQLRQHLPEESLRVYGDRVRLDQALANLVTNAIKVTPNGGTVTIDAWIQDDELALRVRDNGPGIAPDQIEHIFDRYWQVRVTAHQGAGLGLAIVRGILEAHGGRVRVESQVGFGSSFVIYLPSESPTVKISSTPSAEFRASP